MYIQLGEGLTGWLGRMGFSKETVLKLRLKWHEEKV